jgi:hypothetical protein
MDSKASPSYSTKILIPIVATYALLWVALLNGYPTIFPDTGQYLIRSFSLEVPPYRTIFYSIFMRLTSFGISPWLVVIAQSALTVFVLRHCFNFLFEHRTSVTRESGLFLGVVLALAWGTALPWSVGQLMPDIFTGLLILCMFLLLYDSQLTTQTSVVFASVIAISIACHQSHLLISCAVLVGIAVLRAFRGARQFWPTRSKKQIGVFVLVPILAGALAVASSNRFAGMGFVLSPGGHMFMLARLFASGMAGSFLRQDCKLEPLTACKYLDTLPTDEDEFLWWYTNPLFNAMGGWVKSKQEANRIILGTIRYDPGRFVRECIKQTFRQFVRMKPGDGNARYFPFEIKELKTVYPDDIPKLEFTRQWNGGLMKLANRLSALDTAVFWCSMVCCLVFLVRDWRYADGAGKLFIFVLISLLANAFVTASLSEVSDRYQSRVSWLMAFCFMAYVISMLRRRQNRAEIADEQERYSPVEAA